MKVCIMTNEYPPNVYGGAGVHVEYLTKELAAKVPVTVHCFGDQKKRGGRLSVQGFKPAFNAPLADTRFKKALDALDRNLAMAADLRDIDIVHCHTWYSHFAGLLARQLYGVPLVLTSHSLEPSRPWKQEQLGTAYRVSAWIERTAYQQADGVIAVSAEMKKDIMGAYGVAAERIAVIHNGIDLGQFKRVHTTAVCRRFGIDPNKPLVLFVGRITRQKGLIYLINAIDKIRSQAQIVLCAGEPDTSQIAAETEGAVARMQRRGARIIWIKEMLSPSAKIELYSHATVFVCPSIYEPFGITNLEAMACGTPVVASNVGGIVEVVGHNSCGFLVPLKPHSRRDCTPADSAGYSAALADKINVLLDNPARQKKFAIAARKRVERYFGWPRIAAQTIGFYRTVIKKFSQERKKNGRGAALDIV
ncbi:MAG: glycogen synthase [Chitinivibrionales bacterium]|nr:glycogen synthase [Chitinivibrionales bacterium]